MIRRPRFLTPQYNYVNPTMRQRAQGLLLMIWAAMLCIVLLVGTRVLLSVLNMDRTLTILPIELVVGAAVLLVSNALIQRGKLDEAIWLFVGLMLVPFVLVTVIAVDPAAPVILLLPLVAGGLLLSRRSFLWILLIFAITLVLRAFNQGGTVGTLSYMPSANAFPELINYVFVMGLSAVFLLVFSGSIERVVGVSFGDAEQLKAANRFSDRLGEHSGEHHILVSALETVEQDLGFNLAQIYLPDTQGDYTHRLRSGFTQFETGTRVALRPGDEAVIQEAVASRQPVIVTSRDSQMRSEHLIPPSRESITLALAHGSQVFGVLDVQSQHRELFTENTVTGLRTLANQIAREIAQARQIAELERSVRDQEATLDRFMTQMSELQRRGESVAAQGWERYLRGRGDAGFGFDYEGGRIVASRDLPAPIQRAIAQGRIHIEQQDGVQVLNVPITLRDQVLGALTFTLPADRPVTDRQLDLLRTVTSRLAVALESNRLFEQTQAQAQRERKASEISSLLLSATEVETVLDLAAENFNEALGAIHTRIVLEPGLLTGEPEV